MKCPQPVLRASPHRHIALQIRDITLVTLSAHGFPWTSTPSQACKRAWAPKPKWMESSWDRTAPLGSVPQEQQTLLLGVWEVLPFSPYHACPSFAYLTVSELSPTLPPCCSLNVTSSKKRQTGLAEMV